MNSNHVRLVSVGHHPNRITSILNRKLTAALAALVVLAAGAWFTLSGTRFAPSRPSGPPLQETAVLDGSAQFIAEDWKKAERQWYAAPNGRSSANGSIEAPWDIATALAGGTAQQKVRPGDVIWLRGGTYTGIFTSTVEGAPELPVHVRQYMGERAILDKKSAVREKGTLNVRGANVWFWDFEIANSFPERGRLDPGGEMDPWRGSGVNVWAPNTKYINLVIRDNGHGFGLWNEEGGTEIYGCIVFNNGNNKKEHGVYGHNKTGTQYIRDNIIFNSAGYGLHIYANSAKRSLNGFQIEGNAVFNNGSLMNEDQVADQILVGGVRGVPAERIVLRENYIYNRPESPTSKNRGVRLGYEDENNRDVALLDNYIVSNVPLKIQWWNSVEARGNTIRSSGTGVEIKTPPGKTASGYKLESNIYWNPKMKSSVFIVNGEKSNFASWQQTGFDRRGFSDKSVPSDRSGTRIFVRPNKYEKGRANIIVYNWNLDDRVPVDLKGVLQPGDKFEVLDAQNFLGSPVLTGTYHGNPIILPMDLEKTTQPTGSVEQVPPHTSAEFGVFVVKKR